MVIRLKSRSAFLPAPPEPIDLRYARMVPPERPHKGIGTRLTSATPGQPLSANSRRRPADRLNVVPTACPFDRKLTGPGPAPLETWIDAWGARLREAGLLQPPAPPRPRRGKYNKDGLEF